jgi:hypothetical protein
MNIPPEVIQAIGQSFAVTKTPKTVKTRPCRIKFNGEFITTGSKKTVWRNKGFAKAALLNHIKSIPIISSAIREFILKEKLANKPWNVVDYIKSETYKQIADELEKQGIIEYIEVDIEDFAIQKR